MTVQLKVTEIRKLIKSQLELSDDALITLNKSVSVSLDDSGKSGEITLKFKANPNAGGSSPKQPKVKPQKTKSKTKSKAKDKKSKAGAEDGLVFQKGEKSKLEKKFKSDFEKCGSSAMALSDFGSIIELKPGPHLIVGIDVERSKYIVRRTLDKTRLATTANARRDLGAISDSPKAKKPKDKKSKDKKSKDKKSDKKIVEFTIVKKKLRENEEKLSKADTRTAKAAFEKQASKLVKDGVDPDWFYKVLKVKNKSLRMIGLDAKSKTVKLVDINTGKTSKLKLSKILPF